MRILWLDNDLFLIRTEVKILEEIGFDVFTTNRLSEAEHKLLNEKFDLVIIDAMVPTKDEEEEKQYKPQETGKGMHSGAVFYSRMKDRIKNMKAIPIVITQRLDEGILNVFSEIGFPKENVIRKIEIQSSSDFRKMIRNFTHK